MRAQQRGVVYRSAAAVGGLSLALSLAACSLPWQQDGRDDAASTAEPSATVPPEASLARFYSQTLSWTGCQKGKCAELSVPVDYADPNGPTIKIAVKKMVATGKRQGSLVVNPGGPGASGVDYVDDPAYVVSAQVQKAYDVVGFDPRGVSRSAPIRCYTDAQMDQLLSADPSPDDSAEESAVMSSNKAFGAACQARSGALLGHVSTVEAAKDMDVLRAALGSAKLNYLGKSYGTFLGATYADLFPKNVGRFVLDGVVDPQNDGLEGSRGQAVGFERATRAYVQSCVAEGGCPLGGSLDEGMQRLRQLLKQWDTAPLPVSGFGGTTRLTEGWATLGLGMALYDKQFWPLLTEALTSAIAGDGNGLMTLAGFYADRDKGGKYNGNTLQAINAVNCLDRQGSPDPKTYEKAAADFSKDAPTWGPMIAWGNAVCGHWPVKATGAPKKITATGAPTMLIIGTTRDPATPYENSVKLHQAISDSRLISFDGDGHTAYVSSGSRCVDGVVDAYLLKATVPSAEDTRC